MMQSSLLLDIILDKEQTETFRKREFPFFMAKYLTKSDKQHMLDKVK